LIILAILAVALFVTFVHSMSQGYSNQIAHLDEFSRAQFIADSLLAKVQARIQTKRWKDRFFSKAPYYETGFSDFGGEYELYVLDTPGRPSEMDVYAQIRFQRAKRLFFWRLRYETSILDAAGRIFPLVFTATSAQTLNTGTSPMGGFIDDLLATRRKNAPAAAAKAALIKPMTSAKDMIAVLDGPTDPGILDEPSLGTTLPQGPETLTPPPPPPLTTIYEETFDAPPAGNAAIPGFTPRETDAGEIVRTTSSSPPGCYKISRNKYQDLPISISNRLVYEFDIKITRPDSGSGSGDTYIGPCFKLGTDRSMGYNRLSFNHNDLHLNFCSDQGARGGSSQIGLWKFDQFAHIKVDLNFDDLTGDIYVDGVKVGDRLSIKPKSFSATNPWTGQPITVTLDHIEVGGHGSPYQSYIDNIRISK